MLLGRQRYPRVVQLTDAAESNSANRTFFVARKTILNEKIIKSSKEEGSTQTQAGTSQSRSSQGCHAAGGELEQIQFLLGHASVQTPATNSVRPFTNSNRSLPIDLHQPLQQAFEARMIAKRVKITVMFKPPFLSQAEFD